MRVAEQVYGLRDAVVGHKGLLHVTFAQPALYLLRVCQFHPDAVHRVVGVYVKLGHYHAVSAFQRVIAFLQRKACQADGVGVQHEVGVPGVMPFVEVGQRVARAGGCVCGKGGGAVLARDGGQQQEPPEPSFRNTCACRLAFGACRRVLVFTVPPHRLSSDTFCSRTTDGTVVRRSIPGNKVRGKGCGLSGGWGTSPC